MGAPCTSFKLAPRVQRLRGRRREVWEIIWAVALRNRMNGSRLHLLGVGVGLGSSDALWGLGCPVVILEVLLDGCLPLRVLLQNLCNGQRLDVLRLMQQVL